MKGISLFFSSIIVRILIGTSLVLLMGTGIFLYIFDDMDEAILAKKEYNKQYLDSLNAHKATRIDLSKKANQALQVMADVKETNLFLITLLATLDENYQSRTNTKWTTIRHELDSIEVGMNKYPKDMLRLYLDFKESVDGCRDIQNGVLSRYNNDVLEPYWVKNLNAPIEEVNSTGGIFISYMNEYQNDLHFELKKPEDSRPWVVVFILVFILFGALVAYLLVFSVKKELSLIERQALELTKGNLSQELEVRRNELRPIVNALNFLNSGLTHIKEYAQKVAQNDFTSSINTFDKESELGKSFENMRQTLLKVSDEENRRTKVNQGLAKFSEIIGNYTNNMELFGDQVISSLVKFLGANQGAFFVANEEGQVLEMISSYAYEKKKFVNKKLKKGQGLAGQVWQEGKKLYMKEVPEEYVSITSGLGHSTPRCILIIPLHFNEQIHGIIEVASFTDFEQYELEFVDKVAENIASALASVKVNTTTQKLLLESKELTEQMRAQEEEMRQNMEELQATQEELERREEEKNAQIKALEEKLKQVEQK